MVYIPASAIVPPPVNSSSNKPANSSVILTPPRGDSDDPNAIVYDEKYITGIDQFGVFKIYDDLQEAATTTTSGTTIGRRITGRTITEFIRSNRSRSNQSLHPSNIDAEWNADDIKTPFIDVEVTGYFKVVTDSDDSFFIRTRGGRHSAGLEQYDFVEEGTCYGAGVSYHSGSPRFYKEMPHPNFHNLPGNITPTFLQTSARNRWIGIKVITVNTVAGVKTQVWIDNGGIVPLQTTSTVMGFDPTVFDTSSFQTFNIGATIGFDPTVFDTSSFQIAKSGSTLGFDQTNFDPETFDAITTPPSYAPANQWKMLYEVIDAGQIYSEPLWIPFGNRIGFRLDDVQVVDAMFLSAREIVDADDETVRTNAATQAAAGEICSATTDPTPTCPVGQHYDVSLGICVNDTPTPIETFTPIYTVAQSAFADYSYLDTSGSSRVGEVIVTSGSTLVGKAIKRITVYLYRYGSPTGTILFTVRDASDNVVLNFGSMEASGVSGNNFTPYTFTASTTRTLVVGDKILVEYGGNNSSSTNSIWVGINRNESFGGTTTVRIRRLAATNTYFNEPDDVAGIFYSSTTTTPTPTCPTGQHYDPIVGHCVADDTGGGGGGGGGGGTDETFVPVLRADLASQIQQANKYVLQPNTEGKGPAGGQFYKIGGRRRVATGNYQSGSQGASDGIRNNMIFPFDMINQEVTWIFTITEIRDTKSKDHYGAKCGSHADSGSALYTNSVEYFGDAGDNLKFQQETPHGSYRPMSCGIVDNKCPPIKAGLRAGDGNNPYPIAINKKFGWKFVRWSVKNSSGALIAIHIETYIDYEHGGVSSNKADWIKLGHADEPFPAGCTTGGVGPVITKDGLTIPHILVNGNVENTLRVNGAVCIFHEQSTVEIDAPPVPR